MFQICCVSFLSFLCALSASLVWSRCLFLFVVLLQWWFTKARSGCATEPTTVPAARPPPEPDSTVTQRLFIIARHARPDLWSLCRWIHHFLLSITSTFPSLRLLSLLSLCRHVAALSSTDFASASDTHHSLPSLELLQVGFGLWLSRSILCWLVWSTPVEEYASPFSFFPMIAKLQQGFIKVVHHAVELGMTMLRRLPPWPDSRLFFLPVVLFKLLVFLTWLNAFGLKTWDVTLVNWCGLGLFFHGLSCWCYLVGARWLLPWFLSVLRDGGSSAIPSVTPGYARCWWLLHHRPTHRRNLIIVHAVTPPPLGRLLLRLLLQLTALAIFSLLQWCFYLPATSTSPHMSTVVTCPPKTPSPPSRHSPSSGASLPLASSLPFQFESPLSGVFPDGFSFLGMPWEIDLDDSSPPFKEFVLDYPSSHSCVLWTQHVQSPCWRLSRTIARRHQRSEDHLRRAVLTGSLQSSSSPPSPSIAPAMSFNYRVSKFLSFFHPAEAARAIMTPWHQFSDTSLQTTVPLDLHSSSPSFLSPLLFIASTLSKDVHCLLGHNVVRETPLIIDTGASVCISPHRDDFVTYGPSKVRIKALSNTNLVEGEGLVQWKVLGQDGDIITLELPGYHIPSASVRLLSPQVVLQNLGGTAIQTVKSFVFTLDSGVTLEGRYNSSTNLPQLQMAFGDSSSFWSQTFDFHDVQTSEFAACLSVVADGNKNLSAAQKDLLVWHHRLSHASVPWVQALMRDRRWLPNHDNTVCLHNGPILPSATPRAPNCDVSGLKCAACLMAKANRRSPKVSTTKHDSSKEMSLKTGHLTPGDCVSCDHYVSPVAGRKTTTFGRNPAKDGYRGGSLFEDHASMFIFNECQVTLTAGETIKAKQRLESEAHDAGRIIKCYHTDNGVFASAEFKDHCQQRQQKLKFSGVGAHHQNGVAERGIQTVSRWARASMIFLQLSWPEFSNTHLWPLAIDYAVWVYNRLPKVSSGLSPLEIWTGVRSTHDELRRAHVFGCPVYVLEPQLQDGKSIPKWNSKAQQGMFVGFSKAHSSLVPLVLNLKTGKISPQFHVIFDDRFQTVPSLQDSVADIDAAFGKLFTTSTEFYLDTEVDSAGRQLVPRPPLDDDWLDEEELSQRQSRRAHGFSPLHSSSSDIVDLADVPSHAPSLPAPSGAPAHASEGDSISSPLSRRHFPSPTSSGAPPPVPPVSEGETTVSPPLPVPPVSEGDPGSSPFPSPRRLKVSFSDDVVFHDPPSADGGLSPSRYPRRHRNGDWKSGPVNDRSIPHHKGMWKTAASYALALSAAKLIGQPLPLIANHGGDNVAPSLRIRKTCLSASYLQLDKWNEVYTALESGVGKFAAYLSADFGAGYDVGDTTVSEFQPHVLAAKTRNEDNPSNAWPVR
ncbi:hypothetical protein ACHAXS_008919 [Conticribra weissflogii]